MLSAAFASAAYAQPGPLPAADSAKQGTDLYNAGDYAGAVAPLQRAVEMEPNNFDYRFMLAQALRQSGKCADAMPHYKQLEASAPSERANDVKAAMAACPNAGITQPEPTPPPPPPPAPEPVQRSGMSRGNALMLAGAGAGIAAGVSKACPWRIPAPPRTTGCTVSTIVHSAVSRSVRVSHAGATLDHGLLLARSAL